VRVILWRERENAAVSAAAVKDGVRALRRKGARSKSEASYNLGTNGESAQRVRKRSRALLPLQKGYLPRVLLRLAVNLAKAKAPPLARIRQS